MSRSVTRALVVLLAGGVLLPIVRADDDPATIGIQFKIDENSRKIIVQAVVGNSPGAKAGIKEGDILVKVGDAVVDTLQSVVEAVKQHKPGDKVKVVVMRNNEEKTIEVTLAKRSEVFPNS